VQETPYLRAPRLGSFKRVSVDALFLSWRMLAQIDSKSTISLKMALTHDLIRLKLELNNGGRRWLTQLKIKKFGHF
jgi:hypothetical protein